MLCMYTGCCLTRNIVDTNIFIPVNLIYNAGHYFGFIVGMICSLVINLTSAQTVIHYDPWWNLSSENQATDRAYRIGQKNSVQVYKLITSNSIEEKINKLQEKKAKISEQLLSTEETFINKLSKEEIMSLFE